MIQRYLFAFTFLVIGFTSNAQEKSKQRIPLFVSHLSDENAAITRRKDAPPHFFLTRLICFQKKCRTYIGWRNHQRSMRYDYNKASKYQSKMKSPTDSVIVPQDKPIKKMPTKEVSPPRKMNILQSDSIIVLNELLFETNRYQLRPELYPTLDSIAIYLKKELKAAAIISGHTDNTGKEEYNLQLSSQRAEAVAEYLLDQGIEPQRVSFIGFGSNMPLQPNETPEGRRKNRRVEILIKRKN